MTILKFSSLRTIGGGALLFLWILIASCAEDEQLPSGPGDFLVNSGDATLSGTLILPVGAGPFPVVISVHGSGRTTRNNNSFIFDDLAPAGIAVLKFDKRGVGLSTGEYVDVNAATSVEAFDELADDVVAWVDFLSKHKNIDAGKIGLAGASQAGWIIPVAAAKSDKIKFMINVVGPTVTVGREAHYSLLTKGQQFDNNDVVNGFTITELTNFVDGYNGFQGFDPLPTLNQIDIPGLWIYGRLDESIPTASCITLLENLKNKSKPFEYVVYDNANHALIDRTTGNRVQFMTSPGGGIDWIKRTLEPD